MKKNNRMRHLAVFLAAALLLAGCSDKEDTDSTAAAETADTGLAVSAAAPERGSLAVSSTFIGTVSPQEQVNIIPLVSGEVAAANFEVGDQVQAGDILLQIDDEAARLQLESAKLTKEGAELSAQRTLGSGQVMSNLSMESNIKNIQYQIDMAKKQYDTAGNSIADTQQKKEDMKSALDKINDSIGDMEENYKGMKSMAVTAKQYVYQDASGVWRWVTEPEPDWNALYETDPAAGGETESGESESGGTTPGGNQGNGGPAESNSNKNSGGNTNLTESESAESTATESTTTESTATESTATENTAAENTKQEENTESGSSAEPEVSGEEGKETSAAESPAQNGTENSGGTQNVSEESSSPQSEPVRATHFHEEKPAESTAAEASGVSFRTGSALSAGIAKGGRRSIGKEEPAVIQAVSGIGNSSDIVILQIDNQEGANKKSYEEYVKDKAIYEGKKAVVEKFKSAGYSAADVGEGRLDSSLSAYASQIASMKTQASTLESNISSIDGSIDSAETSRSTTGDTIDFYEENLKDAQVQYGIQNGQAYQDTAAALQNQIASSNVGIQSAMLQLENYTLTAPISGVIEQKNVDEFGMVSAGNPVYVISNKDSMTVTFYVSEAAKNQLAAGGKITLERNGETFEAVITQVGQSVDSRTGLFEIKASTENTRLSNGVTVKVTADTYQTEDALLLPFDAVHFENEKTYVYCLADGKAVKTQVETGLYNEDKMEITGGLAADSIVIHTWSSQLTDGAKVRLVEGEEAQ